jgi:hypothetical protein
LVAGELQGAGTTAVKGEARASLTLTGAGTGYYEVKVRPDVSGLAVGEEVTAGICLGQTTEGRYVVGVRAFKVTEFGSPVLKRRLELRWLPTTGAAVVEAGGEAVTYGGESLTLAL